MNRLLSSSRDILWSVVIGFCILPGMSTAFPCIDTPILLDFKKHADTGIPSVLSEWTANIDACEWKGISCTTDGQRRVREIDISGWSEPLRGRLPASIGRLTYLEGLFLARNNLKGSLPSISWGESLQHLQAIDLHGNAFEGPLPPSLGSSSKLQYLDLSSNNLNGSIPSEFGLLESVVHLRLSRNQLSGTIPSTFKNLGTKLRGLYLDHNRISGEIPNYLSKMMDLLYLALQDNRFFGDIPEDFLSIIRDDRLEVQNNYLTGLVKEKLETFDYLNLDDNCLTDYKQQKAKCDLCGLTPNPCALIYENPRECINVAYGKYSCNEVHEHTIY